jgi:hypothetical protein
MLSSALKASRFETKYKFGVEVPHSVKHAIQLDKENGDSMWQQAMETELRQINTYETFRDLEGKPIPDGYKKIPYQIIFDVKFDLRRKARLVAGGHMTDPPIDDIYSGVVGMEAIRTGFTLATLNDLGVCAADIGNAFLYGRTREKVYIIAGPEFGEDQGKPLIIDKGLYGLQSSSARFHEHLATKLRMMGYTPSYADPDFWIKDCITHYEYLATYVDDILAFSKNPMVVINEIKKDYVLKGIGIPEYYLGGNVEALDENWNKDGIKTGLSARTYIENVIEKMELLFEKELRTYKTPMEESYHPEMDDTPLVSSRDSSKYRGMVGSCNWLITLGRFDINYATQALSRFSMAPREGHFKAMQRVLGYLKKFPKGRIIIDTNHRDWSSFPMDTSDNWKDFYPDAAEEMPPNMPLPKGKGVRITCYVDADHAHDQLTRRSVTGIIILVNNTPIKWLSKRQKTVESSTYGSEMVASRIATDMVIALRYNLRMLGVPVDGPSLMLGDNQSVIISTTMPSSALNQKHNAIAYHRVREAIAGGIIRFHHISTHDNLADIMTKPLPATIFYRLAKPLLFRSANYEEPAPEAQK